MAYSSTNFMFFESKFLNALELWKMKSCLKGDLNIDTEFLPMVQQK